MEGIRDGHAQDRCYYCALIVPDVSDCPKCHGRMQYRAARLGSVDELHSQLREAWRAWSETPSPQAAERVAKLAHELGPEASVNELDRDWLSQLRALLRKYE